MRRKRPEDEIQRAVFRHLRQRGVPEIVAFHVPNGGARSKTEAAIMMGLGVLAGIPDIIIIKDGRVYALELKTPKGKLSAAQDHTMRQLACAGARVGTAYGLDEAIQTLELWGLLRGRAVLNLSDLVVRMEERENKKEPSLQP